LRTREIDKVKRARVCDTCNAVEKDEARQLEDQRASL